MNRTDPEPTLTSRSALGTFSPFGLLRRLYDWVVGFAEKPHGTWALFLIALAEASFFPIPPDVLLIALAIGVPKRGPWFAAVCTLGSCLGAVLGYLIGYQFYELIGKPIVDFYAAEGAYLRVQQLYEQWNAVAVAIAGLTPIPFKVVTIAAGAFKINFPVFILAAIASRGARFFVVGGLIWWFGPGIQSLIDRYFNVLAIIFSVLLIGGFLILKYVI